MINFITMMFLSSCSATGSTPHLGFLLPGLGSMVATTRMRMLTPISSLSCAALDIHRVHRSSIRNSLDLALARTPDSLKPTLVRQRNAYWEEVNPLMAKWRHINNAKFRECSHMVRVNMSQHVQLDGSPVNLEGLVHAFI